MQVFSKTEFLSSGSTSPLLMCTTSHCACLSPWNCWSSGSLVEISSSTSMDFCWRQRISSAIPLCTCFDSCVSEEGADRMLSSAKVIFCCYETEFSSVVFFLNADSLYQVTIGADVASIRRAKESSQNCEISGHLKYRWCVAPWVFGYIGRWTDTQLEFWGRTSANFLQEEESNQKAGVWGQNVSGTRHDLVLSELRIEMAR